MKKRLISILKWFVPNEATRITLKSLVYAFVVIAFLYPFGLRHLHIYHCFNRPIGIMLVFAFLIPMVAKMCCDRMKDLRNEEPKDEDESDDLPPDDVDKERDVGKHLQYATQALGGWMERKRQRKEILKRQQEQQHGESNAEGRD